MDGRRIWGATAQEQAAAHPCDGLPPGAQEAWFRAVSVQAPAPLVFRWLRHALFPVGDLFMMRKHLLTLGRLAERDAAST